MDEEPAATIYPFLSTASCSHDSLDTHNLYAADEGDGLSNDAVATSIDPATYEAKRHAAPVQQLTLTIDVLDIVERDGTVDAPSAGVLSTAAYFKIFWPGAEKTLPAMLAQFYVQQTILAAATQLHRTSSACYCFRTDYLVHEMAHLHICKGLVEDFPFQPNGLIPSVSHLIKRCRRVFELLEGCLRRLRVEPHEIEARLLDNPSITAAAYCVRTSARAILGSSPEQVLGEWALHQLIEKLAFNFETAALFREVLESTTNAHGSPTEINTSMHDERSTAPCPSVQCSTSAKVEGAATRCHADDPDSTLPTVESYNSEDEEMEEMIARSLQVRPSYLPDFDSAPAPQARSAVRLCRQGTISPLPPHGDNTSVLLLHQSLQDGAGSPTDPSSVTRWHRGNTQLLEVGQEGPTDEVTCIAKPEAQGELPAVSAPIGVETAATDQICSVQSLPDRHNNHPVDGGTWQDDSNMQAMNEQAEMDVTEDARAPPDHSRQPTETGCADTGSARPPTAYEDVAAQVPISHGPASGSDGLSRVAGGDENGKHESISTHPSSSAEVCDVDGQRECMGSALNHNDDLKGSWGGWKVVRSYRNVPGEPLHLFPPGSRRTMGGEGIETGRYAATAIVIPDGQDVGEEVIYDAPRKRNGKAKRKRFADSRLDGDPESVPPKRHRRDVNYNTKRHPQDDEIP